MSDKKNNLPNTQFCLPCDMSDLTRRDIMRGAISFSGYMSVSQLLGWANGYAQTNSTPIKKLIWVQMNGGWDILEVSEAKGSSTSGIDMAYGLGDAHDLAGSNGVKLGRWLPRLAQQGGDIVVARGLSMATTSHDAGRIYMDTGVLSNTGRVNAASIPMIVASESQATLPIIQLQGGSEPMSDRGLAKKSVSTVRAQNLSLYQSMYPQGSNATQTRLKILDYLRSSVARQKTISGESDRIRAVEAAEAKIRNQLQDDIASKLSLTTQDRIAFQSNLPQGMGRNDGDAAALALKLIKNDLVTCVNLGFGGFDTHTNQDVNLRPTLERFDYIISTLISELRNAGKLDSTLIVVYSDFGRTPKINRSNGRDHWPVGTAMLIGGGIKGGRAVGGTDDNLQGQKINATTGEVDSGGVNISPIHVGGAVLSLLLGSSYLQYRTYLEAIPALTQLK